MPKFNIQTQAIPTVASAYADIIGATDNQIVEIKNELIIEDNNQHFQIHEDTIEQLSERIAKDGQLSPCIVAPLPDGKYELIDGRHRRRAVIMAGLPTTKCIIKTGLSDQAKKTIRLTSNLIRNNDYLPSELAFAYKELAALEDMKTISEETNLSKKKIYRYIRLTFLIQPLLNRVDNGAIPIIAAVELSYLSKEEQSEVFQFLLNHSDCKITTAIAKDIKENPCDLDSIFYGVEEMDKLSTQDDRSSEQSQKSNDEDSVKTLVDKALKPYQKPESQRVKIENDEAHVAEITGEVDNLSTENEEMDGDSDDEVLPGINTGKQPIVNRSIVVGKDTMLYQDCEGNAHTVDEIEENVLRIICEYVINTSHMDYYIFRYAYDAREIVSMWNQNFIKSSRKTTVGDNLVYSNNNRIVGMADWNADKRMFDIEIHGEHYIFLHKILQDVVRHYIRENYTVERIKEVVGE